MATHSFRTTVGMTLLGDSDMGPSPRRARSVNDSHTEHLTEVNSEGNGYHQSIHVLFYWEENSWPSGDRCHPNVTSGPFVAAVWNPKGSHRLLQGYCFHFWKVKWWDLVIWKSHPIQHALTPQPQALLTRIFSQSVLPCCPRGRHLPSFLKVTLHLVSPFCPCNRGTLKLSTSLHLHGQIPFVLEPMHVCPELKKTLPQSAFSNPLLCLYLSSLVKDR